MKYTLSITLLVLISVSASFGATQQEKLNKKLLKAARNNNQAKIVNLLQAGADINSTNHKQRTSLHYAARNHNAQLVEFFLSHNALVNCQDAHNKTPLHLTLLHTSLVNGTSAQYTTTELLLSYGANVNAQTDKGQTPLHYAAIMGLSSVAELLLIHGANSTLQDQSGADALFYAVCVKTITLLLNFGATDTHWQHPENSESAFLNKFLGINPLTEGKMYYESQTVSYQDLLKQVSSPTRGLFIKTIEEGYYTIVKLCIRNGIPVKVNDLLIAKANYIFHKEKRNIHRYTYKAIGRLLFAYLQLLGIYYTDNTNATNRHVLSHVLPRTFYRKSAAKKSLIGPIAKRGIVGSNYFTEDIVRTIARYV